MYVYRKCRICMAFNVMKKYTSTKSKGGEKNYFFGKMVITAPKYHLRTLKLLWWLSASSIQSSYPTYLPSFFIGVKIYGTSLCKEEFTWDADYYLLLLLKICLIRSSFLPFLWHHPLNWENFSSKKL